MEKKSSNIFSNSASMRELKNRNSLAMLHLRKEIVHFEDQKKLVVTHMEKDRVNQFEFLKEIRICETNLNPHYRRLLKGTISEDRLPNGLKKSRKTVKTAPPGSRSMELSAANAGAIVLPRAATTALPHRVKTQMEMVRNHRRKRPSSHEQAENFLKELREKEAEDDLLLKELTEFDIESILLKRIQNGLSKVSFPNRMLSGRWAEPREPGFYSFIKSNRPSDQSKETTECKPKTFSGKTDSAMSPELVDSETLYRSKGKLSISRGKNHQGMRQRLTDNELKISLTPESRDIPFTDEQTLTDLVGDELPFDLKVLSSITSDKRVFKSKPVELRIHEFLDKLEVMKKEQDIRLEALPSWEKRRRWIALTRGIGAALALSRKKADK